MSRDQIIEALYTGKNFNDCLAKMEPAHLRDDLKQDVISIVLEWPEEKVVKLYSEGSLEFYVVRVILNQAQSSTSPFYKKYRQVFVEIDPRTAGKSVYENDADPNGDAMNGAFKDKMGKRVRTIDEAMADRETREKLEDLALEKIDKLYWYDADMLRLYMKLGSYRAIERETQIPFNSCYKSIQRSIAAIRRMVDNQQQQPQPIFTPADLKHIGRGIQIKLAL